MTEIDWTALKSAATEMTRRSYAPYSQYRVGAAAVTTDGRVVTGCNVENESYGLTLCAECGLISQLQASGGGRLAGFVCVNADGEAITPCGRCRQLLMEHGGPDLLVYSPAGIVTMREMLPQAWGLPKEDAQ
mgnify:FL=1